MARRFMTAFYVALARQGIRQLWIWCEITLAACVEIHPVRMRMRLLTIVTLRWQQAAIFARLAQMVGPRGKALLVRMFLPMSS